MGENKTTTSAAMNTRRTFFKKLYAAAAIVALAPQLAFRAKPEFEWRTIGIYDQLMAERSRIVSLYTPEYKLELEKVMREMYALSESRAPRKEISIITDKRTAMLLKAFYG